MRTVIAGSRAITNYSDLLDALEKAIEIGIRPSVVLSGVALGVDMLGEQWANEFNIPLERYPADWEKHGKRAGYLRNIQMADHAEAVVVVWNGKSRGTKHMIDAARERNLRLLVWIPESSSRSSPESDFGW